jgi:hypothetical protein
VEWGEFMDITGSFLISLSMDEAVRLFTFKHLADTLEKRKHNRQHHAQPK